MWDKCGDPEIREFGGSEVATQDSQYSMAHGRGAVRLEESSDNSSVSIEGKQDRMLELPRHQSTQCAKNGVCQNVDNRVKQMTEGKILELQEGSGGSELH